MRLTYKKPSRYDQAMCLIFGIVFIVFGSFSLIQNIPKSSNSALLSYKFNSSSRTSALSGIVAVQENKSWRQSFPAYSLLIYPPVFIIGGLLCLVSGFSKNKKLKDFLAGLFTLGLGIMLTYFFQSHFPIVLIPLIFVVIGIILLLTLLKRSIWQFKSQEK